MGIGYLDCQPNQMPDQLHVTIGMVSEGFSHHITKKKSTGLIYYACLGRGRETTWRNM